MMGYWIDVLFVAVGIALLIALAAGVVFVIGAVLHWIGFFATLVISMVTVVLLMAWCIVDEFYC